MKDMKTAQMVAEYNQLTGKNIKKFSDRATGEKQLAKARAEHAPAAKSKKEQPVWPFGDGAQAAPKPAKPFGVSPEKAVTGKVHNAPKANSDRGAATAASWLVKKTAKARATRIGVMVGNNTYKSTREAFEALGLPAGKYPFVRVQLKALGSFVFEGRKFVSVKNDA